MKEPEHFVNGKSFFEFTRPFMGLEILNKNGFIIPKFVLFHKGYNEHQIWEKFKIKQRQIQRC